MFEFVVFPLDSSLSKSISCDIAIYYIFNRNDATSYINVYKTNKTNYNTL